MYINTFSLQVHFSALSICAHCVWGPLYIYLNENIFAWSATRFRWSARATSLWMDHFQFLIWIELCVYSITNSSPNSTRPQVKIYISGVGRCFSFPFCRERCVCLCPETPECVYDCARAELAMFYSWLTGLHEDIYPTGGDTAVLTPPWLIFKPLMYSF